ncbi:hypothetical protein ACFX5E_16080 [Flavobacterium sp. LS2P90]|uniref:Uncharacterized protein n=1 Tax=Flavobacterium xylosi TaxID=3230415 RepID=A0ABW6HZY3_9FLAO
MKTKITLHTPVFIFLTRTENFEIEASKYWENLLQNMIFLIKKMVTDYPYFNHSITISIKIDLIPMKVNNLIRVTQPSICKRTLKSTFYY